MVKRKVVLSKQDEARVRACIAHWERMRDGRARRGENPWAESCALCKEYDQFCKNERGNLCPLSQTVGACGSPSSPWLKARRAVLMLRSGPKENRGNVRRLKTDANAMIRALKGLLP